MKIHGPPAGFTYKLLIKIFILLIIGILISFMVFVFRYTKPDEVLLKEISHRRTETLTLFLKNITFLGGHKFLIPGFLTFIIALTLLKKRKEAFWVFVFALTGLWLQMSMKKWFQRPRPDDLLIAGITNYSFPSGHAMMSLLFFGSLILLLKDPIKKVWMRRALTVFFIFLILVIGFSRMYLGVHYLSDVLAGYCLGAVLLLLVNYFINREK
ncbi:MAG: phosphatase PAP2 family protein [Chitinophagaceae bacterium]|nr:phosphatase PAP2 family protein [Chitinophagaceae bacterium]